MTLFRSTDACPPVRLSALYSMPAVPWEFLVVAVGFVPYSGLDWALSHHLEPSIHSSLPRMPLLQRLLACSQYQYQARAGINRLHWKSQALSP